MCIVHPPLPDVADGVPADSPTPLVAGGAEAPPVGVDVAGAEGAGGAAATRGAGPAAGVTVWPPLVEELDRHSSWPGRAERNASDSWLGLMCWQGAEDPLVAVGSPAAVPVAGGPEVADWSPLAWSFPLALEPLAPTPLAPGPVSVGGAARVVMPPDSDLLDSDWGFDSGVGLDSDCGVCEDAADGSELEFSELEFSEEAGGLAGAATVSPLSARPTAPRAPGWERGPSVAPAPPAVELVWSVAVGALEEVSDDALVPEVVEESVLSELRSASEWEPLLGEPPWSSVFFFVGISTSLWANGVVTAGSAGGGGAG